MTKPSAIVGLLSVVWALASTVGCQAPLARQGGALDAVAPLDHLSESMLIEEDAVPPLVGSSWGHIVAAPQGAEPAVSPPECAVFLSHGPASQKAMALRSSTSAAIGVELALTEVTRDLPDAMARCQTFTFDAGTTRSVVTVEPLPSDDLPAGAVRALLHCQRTGERAAIAWDIALVAGYRRGIFVIALYTPGPSGPPFDAALAAGLGDTFRAQILRLDGA